MGSSKNTHSLLPSFWDLEAPHHGPIENHFFDLRSIRAIVSGVREPVLVVGAGQGLIVEELRTEGFECDGVDSSPEMIKFAKLRRNLTLVEADARALPFEPATYATVIYATGVIDFMGDEAQIALMLNEGRRVLIPSGTIFVAFYKLSDASVDFLLTIGLLKNSLLAQKKSLEMYLLSPFQMLTWVANQAGIGYFRAVTKLLGMSLRATLQEKTMTFRMQKLFRNLEVANALIDAAPKTVPYRNEAEIRKLFERLAIPIKRLQTLQSCYIVQV